jgi:hypothetical protein
VIHLGFIGLHLLLGKVRPLLGCHITSVALFRKPRTSGLGVRNPW